MLQGMLDALPIHDDCAELLHKHGHRCASTVADDLTNVPDCAGPRVLAASFFNDPLLNFGLPMDDVHRHIIGIAKRH